MCEWLTHLSPRAAAPSPKLSADIKTSSPRPRVLNKAWYSFKDAQPKSRKLPWFFCLPILEEKRKQEKNRLQFTICIAERVAWCQLPSITELNGTSAGNCTGRISTYPANNFQGNSPLKPEPPAISTAFFPASCWPTQASHCPAFFEQKWYPHFLSSTPIIFKRRFFGVSQRSLPICQAPEITHKCMEPLLH